MFDNGSGQNEQFYRGPSIDASYQVSVHLAKWFQRRRFEKIGQSETRIACGGHVCKWIGTKWAIFIEDLHRYFLPSFSSFGRGVSEEKIKMWKVNGRQTTDAKWWQKLTLPRQGELIKIWFIFMLLLILWVNTFVRWNNSHLYIEINNSVTFYIMLTKV